jgi:hypothetical protein
VSEYVDSSRACAERWRGEGNNIHLFNMVLN